MSLTISIPGLVGAIEATLAVTGTLTCTPDLSGLRVGLRSVMQAAGDLYLDNRTRTGLSDTGDWARIGECLPFQHVESIVPESVIDGMLVPAHVTHRFRFRSSVEMEPGNALHMRVGNYPGSVWLVEGVARTTWMAMVAEVDVTRLIEAEAALEARLAA